ncbi:MAG: metallophosphoesterase [Rubrivivax sp.]|nr:metallophosphoesterase [Rubrivivax sp.]
MIYAIGDIHGPFDLLQALLVSIEADAARRPARQRRLVYLGDYVSRGADSRRVVETMVAAPPPGFTRITLRGNHEDLWLRFLDGDLDAGRHWFDYDGLDTLADYGVDVAGRRRRENATVAALRDAFDAVLPSAHLSFLRSTDYCHHCGDYFFVHAGVRPGVPLERQAAHDLMWIRAPFLESTLDHGAVVVHGHSISERPQLRPNRIGIDTGAHRSGVLTCLVLDGTSRHFLHTG